MCCNKGCDCKCEPQPDTPCIQDCYSHCKNKQLKKTQERISRVKQYNKSQKI